MKKLKYIVAVSAIFIAISCDDYLDQDNLGEKDVNSYYKTPTDIDEAMKLHDDLWNAAIDASLKNGGTLNEHHGVGLKLGRFMKTQHGSSWEFMLGLKKAWDPNGIMNPGKLGFGPPGSA